MSNLNADAAAEKAARIETYRRRYLALKSAGEAPALAPPLPSPRGAAAPEASAVLQQETIPGGWYWATRVARGQVLQLSNPEATPGVSVLIWNADDSSERYNAADTVKLQWNAQLSKGRLLFSDMGRVLASITEDSCAAHDTVVGGSTAASNLEKYGAPCGDAGLRNTRDNFVLAAAKFGLTRRDISPCISFFAPVITDAEGRFVWRPAVLQRGDFVALRAEMNLLIAVSNCPHPLAPDAVFAPEAIVATVYRAPPAATDDRCRTASAEARRGFENTDPLFRA
jgi:uncharacterized protein